VPACSPFVLAHGFQITAAAAKFTTQKWNYPCARQPRAEQASMIRRYIIWRSNHACDERLRRIIDKANVA